MLNAIKIFLEQYGVTSKIKDDKVLLVNRDSMVNAFKTKFEEDSYKECLWLICDVFGRYHWCMKTDDDLFLEKIG